MSTIRPLFVVAGIGNGSGVFLVVFAQLPILTSTQEQGLLRRED